MRFMTASAVGALSFLAAAATANAAPPAPRPVPDHAGIIRVAQGCGFGWHRNHWGDCIPNRFRMYRSRPDTVIEEWDEYDEY